MLRAHVTPKGIDVQAAGYSPSQAESFPDKVDRGGIEPPTFRVRGGRSYR